MDLKGFGSFAFKVVLIHFLTYLVCGLIFSNIFNYKLVFEMDAIKDYYISYQDHNIILGPLLQPIRGLLFAIALWPIKDLLVKKKNGWLTLWIIIAFIGIFSTPSASPSSIEGVLYTKIPLWFHLMGLPEILTQTLLFSSILIYSLKTPNTVKEKNARKTILDLIKALSIACYAYIGYAVGAIGSMLINSLLNTGNLALDSQAISEGGSNLALQLMFVVAAIINMIAVYLISKKYSKKLINLTKIFFTFLLIDVLVPWIYQAIILPPAPTILSAIQLGILPAIIITLSIKYSYKKSF